MDVEAAVYDVATDNKIGVLNSSLFITDNYNEEQSTDLLFSIKQDEIGKAIGFIREKQFVSAKKIINQLINSNPKNVNGYILSAMLGKAERNDRQVKVNFSKVLELDENNIIALHGLADLASKQGGFDQAKRYHNQIIKIDGNYAKSYFALAKIAIKQGGNVQIVPLLNKAYQKAAGELPAQLSVATVLANVYASQSEPAKIITLSNDLIQKYPESNEVLSFKVSALIANKDDAGAEVVLKQLIQKEPNKSEYKVYLTNLLAQQPERLNDVLDLLDQIIEQNPNKIQSYVFKVVHLITLRHYSDALIVAKKVDELFPKYSLGKQLLGRVYLAEKKLDLAVQWYQKAYQQQYNKKVLFNLVDLLKQQGKTDKAIEMLKEQVTKQPDETSILMKIAQLYLQTSRDEKASDYYNQVLQLEKDNVLALNNLAWVNHKMGKEGALALAKQAYLLAPNSATVADTYGYILGQKGDLKNAVMILEKAVALNSKLAAIKIHLAEAYSLMKEKERAVKITDTIDGQALSQEDQLQLQLLLKGLE